MAVATVSKIHRHEKYEKLIALAQRLDPLTTAVAQPCDESSLRGAIEAKDAGLKVGDKLTTDGRATAMADGKQAVDADMLNGKKVERPHPPKHAGGPKGHRGPGDDAGPDGKGADQDPPPPPPQQ